MWLHLIATSPLTCAPQEPSRTLPSVTKLVSHNILNEQYLRTTFPALRALSCDAADSGLAHIAELVGGGWARDLAVC